MVLEVVFDDYLVREQAALDCKNIDFKQWSYWDFFKGVNPWFWSKIENLISRCGKTGNKKPATCFATLLQNELNSDVARFTTHIKPVLQQIRLLTGLNMGGKTRNIAIQLVLSQLRKHVFLDCKILILNSGHIGFSQRGQPMILVKKWKFHLCIFLDKWALKYCLMIIEAENKPS